ncbi:MAG: anaerobic ribonucleoside-triphosphate reductase activating protein [Firmicutes bacterium]|nr:anaerobic ribonucleoside-triphosphate reductase activating protein [Bacillota bacterium]
MQNNGQASKNIRLAGIVEESIVDGDGLRFTIFVQGCPHKCIGCHNPHTHDFDAGKDYEVGELCEKIFSNPLLSGVTFSGGEPFCQPKSLIAIAQKAKEKGLNIWCYTGYTQEEILKNAKTDSDIAELLNLIDVLVDGPFIEEQKDLTLKFRGSKNQRIIQL